MTTPLGIRENEPTDAEWKRKVRDAVNMLIRRTLSAGATAERPLGPVVGQTFYDKTLGVPIWWNGTVWKNAAGTTV